MTKSAFVALYLDDALACQSRYGIWAATVLAVASWESGWGESTNAKVGNNFFGIKTGSAKNPYGTGSRPAPDGGSYVIYPDARSSFLDFGRLLTTNSRYAASAKASYDAAGFARAFIGSGYMTDPRRWETYYPALLARTTEFGKLIPALATTGVGIGSLLIGGLVAWAYYKLSTKTNS